MKAVSISKKSCLPGKILHFCDQVITKLIMQIAQIIKKRWNFTHPCNIRIVRHKLGFYGPLSLIQNKKSSNFGDISRPWLAMWTISF